MNAKKPSGATMSIPFMISCTFRLFKSPLAFPTLIIQEQKYRYSSWKMKIPSFPLPANQKEA
jgi:hypothetical protein